MGAMSEWISVNDRLPEDGSRVLVVSHYRGPRTRQFTCEPGVETASWYGGQWHVDGDQVNEDIVTHWRELPLVPADAIAEWEAMEIT